MRWGICSYCCSHEKESSNGSVKLFPNDPAPTNMRLQQLSQSKTLRILKDHKNKIQNTS